MNAFVEHHQHSIQFGYRCFDRLPDTMVLLTGLGDSAHVYDGFAYRFTDYFHVIGITRRGFIPSSQPEQGYEVATRVHDDIEVLRHFGISKAVFVGHSVAVRN